MIEFIFGFACGWFALQLWVTYRAKKIIAQIESRVEENIKASKENKVEVEFQKQGHKIYAYRVNDGSFISHGDTMTELIEDMRKRFPDVSFVGSSKNIKEVTDEPV